MIKEIKNIEEVMFLLEEFKQNVGNTLNPYLKIKGYYIDNNIVGVIVYEDIYNRFEVDYIVVDSKYRRQGIGKKLLENLINLNPDNITLEVREDNIEAINLYKKMGFEIVSKREKYYGNIDGLLMIRR